MKTKSCMTIAVVLSLLLFIGFVVNMMAAKVEAEEIVEPFSVDFSEEPVEAFLPYYISGSNNGTEESFDAHWRYSASEKMITRQNDTGKQDVTSQYAALYFKDLSLQYFEMEFTMKLGTEAGLVGVVFGSKNMSTRHLGSGNAFYLLPDPKAEIAGSTLGAAKTSAALNKPVDGKYVTALELQYPSELIERGRMALFTANTGASFTDKILIYNLDKSGTRIPMEKTILVTGVEIETENVEIMLGGEPVAMQAHVLPENATDSSLYWLSDVPDIAVVDNDGYLHGLKEGTSVVYAVSEDGNFRASCTVHVTKSEISVEGITLNLQSYTGTVGEKFYLIPTIYPADAEEQGVRWQSSNTSVAMVNSGTVTLIGEGECTITVRDESGKFSAQCKITVVEKNSSGCSGVVDAGNVAVLWLPLCAAAAVILAGRRKTF